MIGYHLEGGVGGRGWGSFEIGRPRYIFHGRHMCTKARELAKEKYPDEASSFKLSHRWFEGFCRRYRICLRRKSHTAQKSAVRTAIEKFHAKSSRERIRGTFTLKDLDNMDQTPLAFVVDDNRTYEKTGVDEVWIASSQSGLEKRQCTV